MVTFNDSRREDTVILSLSGKVTKEDYIRFVPVFEEMINKYGKIRALFLLDNYDHLTLGALAQEIKFDLKHRDGFSKIAFLGDKEKLGMAEKAAKSYFSGEVKLFALNERELAQNWVEG
jgi:hypothetical protein